MKRNVLDISSVEEHVGITYPDRPHVRFVGRISNISSAAVRLTMSKPLLVDAQVLLEFSTGCYQAGRVLYCNREGNGFVVTISMPTADNAGAELRTEAREKLVEEATVTVLEGDRSWKAVTTDISPSGLGLLTSHPLEPGQLMRVEVTDLVLFGDVRHCQWNGSAYRVGLHIELRLGRNVEETTLVAKVKTKLKRVFGGRAT